MPCLCSPLSGRNYILKILGTTILEKASEDPKILLYFVFNTVTDSVSEEILYFFTNIDLNYS